MVQQGPRIGEVAEGGLAGHLDPRGEVGGLALGPAGGVLAVDLHHLGLDVPGDHFPGRAGGDEAAPVHDGQAVAQALGLVHEVGREQHRLALLGEPLQALPDEVAGLGIEARGGLVEDQQVRVVHQGPGEGQAPFHAAGQGVEAGVRPPVQAAEFQQLRDAGPHGRVRQAEVAAIDQEVLGNGEIRVQVVHLGHDAHPQARPAGFPRHSQA